ncbi:MAG: hypothetical protein Q8R30_02030 [bacterium]|nr:hypothetical protein [bacterium]MDZ4285563.1 hypothetical protein [Candidatus Sungbacteria bacterium]
MAETFASLAQRVQTEDPTITPEKLEKLITDRVYEVISDTLQQIENGADMTLLRQVIQDRFGLCCEMAPSTSIYVNVSNEPNKNIFPPFSTLQFEQGIQAIMENSEHKSVQDILDAVNTAINNICASFLHAVILSQPLLKQIFVHLKNAHHVHELTMGIREPVKIATAQQIEKNIPPVRLGMYL